MGLRLPNIGQQILTPSTSQQPIKRGTHNGSGYVTGDSNLIPANILSGKSIFGIAGTLAPGKAYATGSATSNGTLTSVQYAGSTGTTNEYTITVTGLTFKPSFIIAIDITNHWLYVYESIGDGYYSPTFKMYPIDTSYGSSNYYNFKADYGAVNVTSTGFTMPVSSSFSGANITWYAYG